MRVRRGGSAGLFKVRRCASAVSSRGGWAFSFQRRAWTGLVKLGATCLHFLPGAGGGPPPGGGQTHFLFLREEKENGFGCQKKKKWGKAGRRSAPTFGDPIEDAYASRLPPLDGTMSVIVIRGLVLTTAVAASWGAERERMTGTCCSLRGQARCACCALS